MLRLNAGMKAARKDLLASYVAHLDLYRSPNSSSFSSVFHNTDTSYLPPPLALALSVIINMDFDRAVYP